MADENEKTVEGTCPLKNGAPCTPECKMWLSEIDRTTMKAIPGRGFCSISLLGQAMNGLTGMVSQILAQAQVQGASRILNIGGRN